MRGVATHEVVRGVAGHEVVRGVAGHEVVKGETSHEVVKGEACHEVEQLKGFLLRTNPISAALREFRMIAHASCRATQALSNALQITQIKSLITEIQPFSRGHYLHFWNN